MTPRQKKMIPPLVVAGIMILYYMFFFGLLVSMLSPLWAFVLGIVPLALAAVMIKVCRERLEEIKRGEEDDLGKY